MTKNFWSHDEPPPCGPKLMKLMQQMREKINERALPNVLPSRWKLSIERAAQREQEERANETV